MAMFENLSDRLQGIFKDLRKRGKLNEADVDAAMREIRMALLEADVHYGVVKDFVKRVRERAVGVEVAKSLTPGQQVVKIVHDMSRYDRHDVFSIRLDDHRLRQYFARLVNRMGDFLSSKRLRMFDELMPDVLLLEEGNEMIRSGHGTPPTRAVHNAPRKWKPKQSFNGVGNLPTPSRGYED